MINFNGITIINELYIANMNVSSPDMFFENVFTRKTFHPEIRRRFYNCVCLIYIYDLNRDVDHFADQ